MFPEQTHDSAFFSLRFAMCDKKIFQKNKPHDRYNTWYCKGINLKLMTWSRGHTA